MLGLCSVVLLHFLFGQVDLFPQLPGGHAQNAAAQGAQLHKGVGGGYPEIIVTADLGHQAFDIGIGGFAFRGVSRCPSDRLPDQEGSA